MSCTDESLAVLAQQLKSVIVAVSSRYCAGVAGVPDSSGGAGAGLVAAGLCSADLAGCLGFVPAVAVGAAVAAVPAGVAGVGTGVACGAGPPGGSLVTGGFAAAAGLPVPVSFPGTTVTGALAGPTHAEPATARTTNVPAGLPLGTYVQLSPVPPQTKDPPAVSTR